MLMLSILNLRTFLPSEEFLFAVLMFTCNPIHEILFLIYIPDMNEVVFTRSSEY